MKTFLLLAALVAIGLAAPTAVEENKRAFPDKRNFIGGQYVPAGEEGETAVDK
ncbi:hypothetical protein F5B18DRAFT_499757 [Nemania serpens]|nr:hypothetical protein F5B18DRAFT_499757 [Nemania serpens]